MPDIKIPIKNRIEEYEFRQNVPIRDYLTNSALWTFIVSMTVIETCIPIKKPRIEVREQSKFKIVKWREAIIPYDWETQNILVSMITVANEAFWRCHKALWRCHTNMDPEHLRTRIPELDTPAVSCLNAVGLALYESKCNIDEFEERMEYYTNNPGRIIKHMLDKGFLVTVMNPIAFKRLLAEIGADTI
ncbi:MAG: hypothetical protein GSR85_02620 [Desulfurococcales archaeon]|nr:hypothetical protein [Desulfurococcales archaeon]